LIDLPGTAVKERIDRNLSVFEVNPAPENPRGILVFLHGVGASERSMASLVAAAPADHRRLVLRAPISMGPAAFAWFHVEFTAQGPVLNESEARRSLGLLEELVVSLRAASPGLPICLVGFSQGAILSLLLSVTAPQLVERAICFSGRFPEEFERDVQPPLDSQHPEIWIGHGVDDQKLNIGYARAIHRLLERRAYKHSYNEYAAQHEVTPAMLSDAYRWLDQ